MSKSMNFAMRAAVLAFALAAVGPVWADTPGGERVMEIFGWVERVELLDGRFSMKAKLDTGALNSSLHATGIETFRRDGERFVRFMLTDPDTGEVHELEKPLVRNVRIVRHNGEHQRRPVVQMNLCIGPFSRQVEVNLVDRSELIYPMLLGRTALEGVALIDSSSTFENYPSCNGSTE